jgi:hypothetical protein
MPSTYTPPVFAHVPAPELATGEQASRPVIIVGAGPVGLACALDLSLHGVPTLVLDDGDTVSAGSRAICYANAHALDLAQHAADHEERVRQQHLADLLTPLAKAWATDLGVELTSDALQVFGGMGYIEETGVAQQFRDARIAPIYEGTNGIQAIDLVGRKLPLEDGGLVDRVLGGLVADLDAAPASVADLIPPVVAAVALARELAADLLAMREDPRDALAGATPYLRVLATVVATALVVRGIVTAERSRAAGGAVDAALLAVRTARARVLVRRVLPRVHGLAPVVRAGAGDLYAEGTPAA